MMLSANPAALFHSHPREIEQTIHRVLEGGRYISEAAAAVPELGALEQKVATAVKGVM